jgi:excisionase family DNA binding protein|tara:strand:- start:188 stop:487 length:300 start_codon:yes stop_codon:yes gene_type:complete
MTTELTYEEMGTRIAELEGYIEKLQIEIAELDELQKITDETFLTTKEVAEKLRLDDFRSVHRLLRNNEMPYVIYNQRKFLIRQSVFNEWVARKTKEIEE